MLCMLCLHNRCTIEPTSKVSEARHQQGFVSIMTMLAQAAELASSSSSSSSELCGSCPVVLGLQLAAVNSRACSAQPAFWDRMTVPWKQAFA